MAAVARRAAQGDAMTRRTAVRVFWGGFYVAPLALFVYMTLVFSGSKELAEENPALFVPFIPIGLSILVSGWLLRIDYQGMREVFRRSIHARMYDSLIRPSYDVAGFGAGILLFLGGAIFTVGLVTGVVALVEVF
jgi:hypothetical protein